MPCAKCGMPCQGRKCRTCGDADHQKDYYGVPADDTNSDSVDSATDSKPFECTSCGTVYEHDGTNACPECGARRRRYAGPIAAGGDE